MDLRVRKLDVISAAIVVFNATDDIQELRSVVSVALGFWAKTHGYVSEDFRDFICCDVCQLFND